MQECYVHLNWFFTISWCFYDEIRVIDHASEFEGDNVRKTKQGNEKTGRIVLQKIYLHVSTSQLRSVTVCWLGKLSGALHNAGIKYKWLYRTVNDLFTLILSGQQTTSNSRWYHCTPDSRDPVHMRSFRYRFQSQYTLLIRSSILYCALEGWAPSLSLDELTSEYFRNESSSLTCCLYDNTNSTLRVCSQIWEWYCYAWGWVPCYVCAHFYIAYLWF